MPESAFTTNWIASGLFVRRDLNEIEGDKGIKEECSVVGSRASLIFPKERAQKFKYKKFQFCG